MTSKCSFNLLRNNVLTEPPVLRSGKMTQFEINHFTKTIKTDEISVSKLYCQSLDFGLVFLPPTKTPRPFGTPTFSPRKTRKI